MKSKKFKRALAVVLAVVMLACMMPTMLVSAADGDITIYHTNDMHGAVANWLEYVSTARKETPNSMLLDAGDATQGVAIATYSKGEAIVKLMNAAGYEGMVLGNHEFDYFDAETQTNYAKHNAEVADFPVISANTYYNGTTKYLKDVNEAKNLTGYEEVNESYFIKEIAGKRIGVFGITTLETQYKTAPANLPGISFENEITATRKVVDELATKNLDYVIGLMHVGVDQTTDITSVNIAEQVSGIDIIIDGHSHTQYQQIVNGTYICQTGSSSATLGKIVIAQDGSISTELITASVIRDGIPEYERDGNGDFVLDDNGNKIIKKDSSGNTVYEREPVKADQNVVEKYNEYYAEIGAELGVVIGYTEAALYGGTYNGKNVARFVNTNLGNLIGDAMVANAAELAQANGYSANTPVVAMQNGGGIRDSIQPGIVTVEDIVTVLPFGNTLAVKAVSPSTLYDILEFGVSAAMQTDGVLSAAVGGFPNVGGMRYEYFLQTKVNDLGQTVGDCKLTAIYLIDEDGNDIRKLDRADTTSEIIFASNDFLIGGGDGFDMLADIKHVAEGSALDAVVVDYVKALNEAQYGTFYYKSGTNRALATNLASQEKDYVYTATVLDANGSKLPEGAKVTAFAMDEYMEGNMYTARHAYSGSAGAMELTVDANGQVKIPLSGGQHDVTIVYGDVYGTALGDNTIGMTSGTITVQADLYFYDTMDAEDFNEYLGSWRDRIDELTLADEGLVNDLRDYYEAFPDKVKPLITNLDVLEKMEAKIAELKKGGTTPPPGGDGNGNGDSPNTGDAFSYVIVAGAGIALISVIATKKRREAYVK